MSDRFKLSLFIIGVSLLLSSGIANVNAAEPDKATGLTLEWEELKSHGERSNTWLIIHGRDKNFPKPVRMHVR